MIFWRGWGIVVVPIMFGCALIMEVVTEYVSGNENYYQEHTGLPFLAMIIAAFITFRVGKYLNSDFYVDEIRDMEGLIVEQKRVRKHSLFLIPVEYWSGILIVFGIILLLFPDL